MEKIEISKAMLIDEMFKVLIEFTDIDTALDIINKGKRKEKVEVEWINDQLKLK